MLYFQYADLNRHVDALNAWRNATVLKPEHSLAWNNMIILLDNTGTERRITYTRGVISRGSTTE